mmetsp:Transcript_26577/g.39328  ORF Transcript_26577/g.39328 Transcript_26577/m.39328 type:complete len:564 (-) Transcript_26577:265-1956(-)
MALTMFNTRQKKWALAITIIAGCSLTVTVDAFQFTSPTSRQIQSNIKCGRPLCTPTSSHQWNVASTAMNLHSMDEDLNSDLSASTLAESFNFATNDAEEVTFNSIANDITSALEKAPSLMAATMAFMVFSASAPSFVPPANAVTFGAGAAVVSSPGIVKSITLNEFLDLSPKKQRQYEGGFLSCSTVATPSVSVDDNDAPKNERKAGRFSKKTGNSSKQAVVKTTKKICQPVNVIDELLKEIDVMATEEPERAEEYRAMASNLSQRERLIQRRTVEAALGNQPAAIYFGCALLGSSVATFIMHPIDTLKVRLMGGKGGEGNEGSDSDGGTPNPLAGLLDLYSGLIPNLAKEGPASALYLGVYEYSRTFLETIPYLEGKVLLIYLLAGSAGEVCGSFFRAPAEAVKTRIQAGLFDAPGALQNVFLDPEGRKNTINAWSASLFRDVPHGAILIATFELTKALIVDSSVDVDVNTLLAEAVLGGLGGGLGGFVSTPSDVVVTTLITSIEDGGEPLQPLDAVAQVWKEGGAAGFFSGVKERVGYWTVSYGIFLSVYCSLRQYALAIF